jgi:hypothetical protein
VNARPYAAVLPRRFAARPAVAVLPSMRAGTNGRPIGARIDQALDDKGVTFNDKAIKLRFVDRRGISRRRGAVYVVRSNYGASIERSCDKWKVVKHNIGNSLADQLLSTSFFS